ncbi:hypothetical protein RJ639_009287, partial [Escallonia herrerae]
MAGGGDGAEEEVKGLNQAIGSIEALAKASKEYIMENTDLSVVKAEMITRFFRDPKFYLCPKIDRGNTPKRTGRAWKEPYGVTFPGKPTGQFSEGRVLTDYI